MTAHSDDRDLLVLGIHEAATVPAPLAHLPGPARLGPVPAGVPAVNGR